MKDLQSILIVDDERVNRTLLSELLKEEDRRILLAKNGPQALERLEKQPDIDLILLDVMMPEMDGYEVLNRIKENDLTRNIPVVFITALKSTGDEERGLGMGAADYIGKPFSPAIVRNRVGNLLRFVRQRKLLETLAGRDGLTEVANRRSFDEALTREWRCGQRSGAPLSLMMLDIDHFKQINDNYGHAHGDHALKMVARALSRSLHRPADFLARYGGEEFVVILPNTDAQGGQEVGESLRAAIEALAIEHAYSTVAPNLTLSVGGATCLCSGDSPLELVKSADGMLYEAKRQGRNRCCWMPG